MLTIFIDKDVLVEVDTSEKKQCEICGEWSVAWDSYFKRFVCHVKACGHSELNNYRLPDVQDLAKIIYNMQQAK